jgi:uracil-DNA glycosylase
MTIEEYFGDWLKVLDKQETMKIMGWLKTVNPNSLCPSIRNVFKAFELCKYKDCNAVFIGQDPYPQKGVATGILFGNNRDIPESKLSPSLEVIKEAAINYEIPHNCIIFDQTLESWAKQGILMINSALTCELNNIGSHVMVWRPFMTKFIKTMSEINPGIIYVLFGKQAQTFKPYINSKINHIIEVEHPAYFARNNIKMPKDLFSKISDLNKYLNDVSFKWYEELI